MANSTASMSKTRSTTHDVRILQDQGFQDYRKQLKRMEKDNQRRMDSLLNSTKKSRPGASASSMFAESCQLRLPTRDTNHQVLPSLHSVIDNLFLPYPYSDGRHGSTLEQSWLAPTGCVPSDPNIFSLDETRPRTFEGNDPKRTAGSFMTEQLRTHVDEHPNDRVRVPLLGQRTLDLRGCELRTVPRPVISRVSGPNVLQISSADGTCENGTSRELLFDDDHYPAPISEVQIRPPISSAVESLDDDHANAHIRVALHHTIGHMPEDIITEPSQYNPLSNVGISRMSLHSPFSWCEQQPASSALVETAAETTEYKGLFRQPDSSPITKEQLINMVKEIYVGLAMLEKKCIEIDKRQEQLTGGLCQAHWEALISVHRTLLYGYHEFLTTSQHPSASKVLKPLPEKYAVPARMWQFAIQPLLEILRRKLPNSLDYMLGFINLTYSMITDLLERVEPFQDIWIECLGDLARYRWAAATDQNEREIWAAVSRKWYNQHADCNPDIGRIQHHLAVLARRNVLQQLFHYAKALICAQPFPNAREAISRLLDAGNSQLLHQSSVVTTFLATQSVLLTKGPPEQFIPRANHFLALLRRWIDLFFSEWQHGFYIISVNFASMFQYGEPEATMALEFVQKKSSTLAGAQSFPLRWTSHTTAASLPRDKPVSINGQPEKAASQILPQPAFQGSCLAFRTLSIFLEQMDNSSVYPSAHTSLAFIWCLALHPLPMQQVEQLIPWLGLSKFLNSLLQIDTDIFMIENEAFPLPQCGVTQQLSEDFLIRGQAWSQFYYPEKFFEGAPSEDERPVIEEETTNILRKHRCLWLGVRIATFNRWITYSNQKFEATKLAHNFAPTAEVCGGLTTQHA